MDPDIRSSYQTNRERRRIANKEDVKHVLEELWDFNLDENLCKMFSREYYKGAQLFLDLTKEDMKKLAWREDNGDRTNALPREVGNVHISKNCKVPLTATGKFPSEASKCRCNSISLECW